MNYNYRKLILKFLICMLYTIISPNVLTANDDVKSDYYDFTIPWDHQFPANLYNSFGFESLNSSLEAPLIVDGNSIYDQEGDKAKFWGMAITVSKSFPPKSKKDIQSVVKKISNYGFNLVRINGLDFPQYGLFKYWYKTGSLNRELIDRLDYFISELKKENIYYSFSINNSSLKLDLINGVNSNSHKTHHKKYKFVQLYDESSIETVLKWHKAFYTHKNIYTNQRYIEDNDNLYITLIGEDSIYNGYFRQNGKYLSDENKQSLELLFNQYLKRKYISDAALNNAWGRKRDDLLSWVSESLDEGTIKLNDAKELRSVSWERANDVIQFLYSIDVKYGLKLKNKLKDWGYKGLVALTNDWYGYASVKANAEVGDFMDLHGYFDPMIYKNHNGERIELTRNTSYLALPAAQDYKEFERNFNVFFSSAVDGKPVIISEWNHSSWSPYLYEGPVLLTAYSAFQGYSGLVIHTYFSTKDKGYKSSISNNSLLSQGNPVLMSLSPALSLMFRKNYISQSDNTEIIEIAKNNHEFIDLVRKEGLRLSNKKQSELLKTSFSKRTRVKFPESELVSIDNTSKTVANTQLEWDSAAVGESFFKIDADKAQGLVGLLRNKKTNNIHSSIDGSGAILITSLDDKSIGLSNSVFLSAVSGFEYTDMRKVNIDKFRRWVNLTGIVDEGHLPVKMKKLSGKLTFISDNKSTASIYGVYLDGKLEKLPFTIVYSIDGQKLTIDMHYIDTPWLWIRFDNN